MSSTHLEEIFQTYSRWAGCYDLFTTVYGLGQAKRLRRELIARMKLQPGHTVIEAACGTGLKFPALEGFIGPEGRLIAIDWTNSMLDRARARVQSHQWSNVKLIRGDAALIRLDCQADGVLCTFAIGLMPQPRRVLKSMLDVLRPGGIILIADARLSDRRYGFLVNPLLQLIAYPWIPPYCRGQYFTVRPWEDLKHLLGQISYEEMFGGSIYMAWGRR